MSNLIVTPDLATIVRRVDTRVQYIYSSAWERRVQGQWWNRIAKTRPSSTLKEALIWLLETAKIRAAGDDGGVLDFDDLVEIAHSATNEDWQNGLALTKNQIEDALGGTVVQGSPLDRAARWARHAGNGGAYWPQGKVAYAMKKGKTEQAYDGGAFFRQNHPINPVAGASGGVYHNLFTGYQFSAANLARITAYIRSIKAPDGIVRNLRPRIVAAGPDLEFAVSQVLGADFYTDPKNGVQGAAGSNVIKTRYGFEEPLIADELDETGVWYLGCELIEDDELGGIIYQEREAFSITSFANVSDAELSRAQRFEWHQRGRNTTFYGHPFLLFRVESGGAVSPALPAI